jgi:hypothetical protein
VLVEHHLDIEASELAQVTVGVRVLGTENRADFEHTMHITTEDHLLIELRALCKACLLSEVVKSKDFCTTFGGSSNELR